MVYCNCGSQLSWCIDTNRTGSYWWRCRRVTSPSVCSASTLIRTTSWFQHSRLNFIVVLLLAYSVLWYEHDREHMAAYEDLTWSQQRDQGITSINEPTTCLRWSADPTTKPCSSTSSAAFQQLTGTPHLPIIAVISPRNSPSPHTTLQLNHRPQHVSKWRAHHHGWFGIFIYGAVRNSAAKITNYNTTSERNSLKIYTVVVKHGDFSRRASNNCWAHDMGHLHRMYIPHIDDMCIPSWWGRQNYTRTKVSEYLQH